MPNALSIAAALLFAAVSNLLQLALPLYSMQLFDRVLPTGSLPTLAAITLITGVFIACSVILDGARTVLVTRLVLRAYINHCRRFLAAGNTTLAGETLSGDLNTLRSCLTGQLATTLLDAPWSLAYFIALFCINFKMGVLAICASMFLIAFHFLGMLFGREPRLAAKQHDLLADADSKLAHRNDPANLAMGIQERLVSKWIRQKTEAAIAQSRYLGWEGWWDAGTRGARTAVQVSIFVLAAILFIDHQIQTGAIVASSMLLSKALSPIDRLGPAMRGLRELQVCVRRIRKVAVAARPPAPQIRLPLLKGDVELSDVRFALPGHPRPALYVQHLSIRAGEFVVVTGDEGAGKSILAGLVSGALRPTAGVVRFDGSNVLDFNRADLGLQVGFCPEHASFTPGTIAQIISRGQPDADEDIVVAAELTGAHQFIQQLAQGYQTYVESGFKSLSAGQRRRLALARAFFRQPPLIILDEPMASLDGSGEEALLQALRKLKAGGSTIIVVSRNLRLFPLVDKLILLKDGRVSLCSGQTDSQTVLGPRLATVRG